MRPRVMLAAAARRRGIPNKKIASAMGVSHQAVAQMISDYESEFGKIQEKPKRSRIRISSAFKCPKCGETFWVVPSRIKNRAFCSNKCATKHPRRTIDLDFCRRAIEMRHEGHTWTSIAAFFCEEIVTVQWRIWWYLKENGLLNKKIVYSIWRPTNAEQRAEGRWNHLINRTGFIPS